MLKKIFNLFNPRETNDEPRQASTQEENLRQSKPDDFTSDRVSLYHNIQSQSVADNIVDLRAHLIDALVSYFKPYYGQQHFADTIVVWVSNLNPLLQAEVRTHTFETALRAEFQNRQYHAVADAQLIFETQNPPEDASFAEIYSGVFIEIRSLRPKESRRITRAKITVAGAMGSLFKDPLILDAANQTAFHIGRSQVVSQNGIHINHIAIRDDDPSQASRNDCVSRKQAKIVFKGGNAGFYLQAFEGGCRPLGGSTTKIIHADKEDELRDISSQLALSDGDLIELGKTVLLKYEVLE